MRKLKEVLRLHSLGLSQHQIARSCSISQSTVHDYLSAAQAAGVGWPLPEDWGDQQIEQALFPQRPAPAFWRKHPEPDWVQIHQELQTHKDLTLQLVWQGKLGTVPNYTVLSGTLLRRSPGRPPNQVAIRLPAMV